MSASRYRVSGRFNGSPEATVTVDRRSGVLTVRPLRKRVTYAMRLADVAELVMWRVIRSEVGQ